MIPTNNEIMRGVFKITNTLKSEDITFDIEELTKAIEVMKIFNLERLFDGIKRELKG